ncbi:MAG: LytTR family DNA-binding domain-containing protein [Bacteroidota bacterium]|uniref:LytR/AlgR family response regulator transcription factor n=1 Tax=Leeuwenhoekiella palythoae TaxID=573501 RepID=UPI001CE1C2BD|nr:LytTR family DNA-binding domain-containing protein [Leeuwenhoekiella palythoae]MEC7784487.1 LytTR family DNA-binding domain-containing protein [Bacteroidota bacterium]MEE3226090.1 LytTR family DNA-binding domain-containing protein [Bacteroidota bacterium]UBZ10601.1 LytTR family DNA-binding domain-containing protein [Leeuwenhoekiella palythoae]
MNVLVIEDEKPAARRLSRMLEALELNVLAQLNSVEEAVEWFQNNEHPDLIFLDIQLSDGLSFEIFDAVEVTSAIIFTTAYDEYALQAFKLNSIDYLLKPIDDEELEAAVKKFKKQQPQKQDVKLNFDDIRQLLGVNPVEREYKKRFTVKIGQHIKMINIEDVCCIYSENKGTYARTLDKRDYLLDTTLETLEEELAPDVFFRVSRKYYVNVNAIQDIISYTNSRLQLKLKAAEDQEIIVSRERVKDFKLWLS